MTTHKSRALRFYLIAKGRLGRYDKRMLAYNNVPHVSNKHVQRFIAQGYGAGLVPTATTNGKHASGSYHKLGRAADMGLRRGEIGTKKGLRKLRGFQDRQWKRGGHTELLGPINSRCILKGHRTTLAEGSALENQHDNHVHGAF